MWDYRVEHDAPQNASPVQPIYISSGAGAIVVIAITVFAIVILYATTRDAQSATAGIWGSVIFFGITTPIGLMAANGSLAAMFRYWQEQRTLRALHAQPLLPAPQVSLVEPPQLPSAPPAQLPQHSTFVPPVAAPSGLPDDSARREAAAWLLQLYQADGTPDPKKVLLSSDKERPGRVRIAAPSRPAKQHLLDRGIIHDLGNGYRLNLVRCPTIAAAQNHLAQTNGVGGLPTQGYPTPTLENGAAR